LEEEDERGVQFTNEKKRMQQNIQVRRIFFKEVSNNEIKTTTDRLVLSLCQITFVHKKKTFPVTSIVSSSFSGPGGAVRGGGKCPTAPPAGKGYLGDQSEKSGNRPVECRGAERPAQQGGHHIFTVIIVVHDPIQC